MFVPFQRLGDTDNTTGVGLGLALSRGFAEAMGGTLTAEETPGGGLTMTVSMPAVAATAHPDEYEPGHRERDAGFPEHDAGSPGRPEPTRKTAPVPLRRPGPTRKA